MLSTLTVNMMVSIPSLAQAKAAAESSAFIADILPPSIIDYYTR